MWKWKQGMLQLMLALLVITLLVFPNKSSAASFELGGDPDLNCVVTLRGQIEPGDSNALKAFVAANKRTLLVDDGQEVHRQTRLCLDSGGGSVSEALKIIDALVYGLDVYNAPDEQWTFGFFRSLGTAIPSGAQCESACALIFMSGGFITSSSPLGTKRAPDRAMHVNAKLGFHAPRLQISGENFTRYQVEAAFDAAVGVTREISRRATAMNFPHGAFYTMVSTPPSEMFYIETVGQAAALGIQLYGSPEIQGATSQNVANICINLMTNLMPKTGRYEESFGDNPPPTEFIAPVMPDTRYTFRYSFAIPEYFQGLDQYESARLSASASVIEWGERHLKCKGTYSRASGRLSFDELPDLDSGIDTFLLAYSSFTNNSFLWLLYPPYTKLSDLAGYAKAKGESVPGGQFMTPVIQAGKTPCATYRGWKKIQEFECDYSIGVAFSLDGLVLDQYVQFRSSDGKVFSYDIDIFTKSSLSGEYIYFAEKIVGTAENNFLGQVSGDARSFRAPEELKFFYPAETHGYDQNRFTCWGPCFQSGNDDTVWCFNNDNTRRPSYDSSQAMFPE